MIGDLRAALAMLTRLPVGQPGVGTSGGRAFGLVGALVGLAGFVPLVWLGAVVPPIAAVLAVGAMAFVSGALHLDGLADTADALLAPGRLEAERARKDPSIGVGGAVALILIVGLDLAALALLTERSGALVAGLACVVGGAGSRVAPIIVARSARSWAKADGLGAWFSRQTTWLDAAVAGSFAGAFAVAAAVLSASPGPAAGGALGLLIGVAVGLVVVRRRNQLDGDSLGAAVELSFAASLACTATLVRWPVG